MLLGKATRGLGTSPILTGTEGEAVFEYLKQLRLEILLPLAKSRQLYTYLGVEHRAQ